MDFNIGLGQCRARTIVCSQGAKRAASRRACRPSTKVETLAYFKLSSVMSKASFATTVEPHQLETRPAGLTCDTRLDPHFNLDEGAM